MPEYSVINKGKNHDVILGKSQNLPINKYFLFKDHIIVHIDV